MGAIVIVDVVIHIVLVGRGDAGRHIRHHQHHLHQHPHDVNAKNAKNNHITSIILQCDLCSSRWWDDGDDGDDEWDWREQM